jgi:hypothetical protein
MGYAINGVRAITYACALSIIGRDSTRNEPSMRSCRDTSRRCEDEKALVSVKLLRQKGTRDLARSVMSNFNCGQPFFYKIP